MSFPVLREASCASCVLGVLRRTADAVTVVKCVRGDTMHGVRWRNLHDCCRHFVAPSAGYEYPAGAKYSADSVPFLPRRESSAADGQPSLPDVLEGAVLPAPTIATTHVVWLSGGKDSTAMALRLVEMQPETEWRFVCTPTGNELPDVYDHWERMGELLGKPLERVAHPLGLTGLIEAQQMLPSHAARWCTRMLKIQPALAWYAKHAPCVAYVGLRADEPEREGLFGSKVPQRYPMREWGWGLPEVLDYLQRRAVKVPTRTDCAWCYDQSLPDWWEMWKRYPAIFEQGTEWETKMGHTFRSPSRDTWPVKLVDLRQRFESGDVPRNTALNRDLFDAEPTRCLACLL